MFVPNARTIPATDELVTVSAELKPHWSGDVVNVTLRPTRPDKPFKVADVPRLYLQIEADAFDSVRSERSESFYIHRDYDFTNRAHP